MRWIYDLGAGVAFAVGAVSVGVAALLLLDRVLAPLRVLMAGW